MMQDCRSGGDLDFAIALSLSEHFTGGAEGEDEALAKSLQKKYESEELQIISVQNPPAALKAPDAWKGSVQNPPALKAPYGWKGIVDDHWELTDPNPDIYQLFVEYDSMFFGGKLTARGVVVDWSKRMTL